MMLMVLSKRTEKEKNKKKSLGIEKENLITL